MWTAIFIVAISALCIHVDSKISSNNIMLAQSTDLRKESIKTEDKSEVFPYKYEEAYFTVPVDHFSFASNYTFQVRYLINTTYWKQPDGSDDYGPIFFYTGNEGDIESFANNTGFMWDIAPKYNALLMFAEHRYYGKSLPFGNMSLSDPKYFGYLTSEQALADFAYLLTSYKANVTHARNSPVITFGGSYGGMLSAWLRIKYPHVVDGAIAASAPVFQFEGMTPCNAFSQIVTRDFNISSVECMKTIQKSWSIIDNVTSTTTGKNWIKENWKLCDNLTSSDNVTTLKDWLKNIWINLAMVNYPYEAQFLEPLPAYPIQKVCQVMPDSSASNDVILLNIFSALNIYFNYTGNTHCLNINQQNVPSIDDKGWNVQACTEMVMPSCSDGIHDFFEPSPWNLTAYVQNCTKKFGIIARPMMASVMYGGKKLEAASNIVFSNGLMDPWSSGGVLKSISDSVVSVIIPEGAHHLDLRASNPADPPSVIQARNTEMKYIGRWISQATSNL